MTKRERERKEKRERERERENGWEVLINVPAPCALVARWPRKSENARHEPCFDNQITITSDGWLSIHSRICVKYVMAVCSVCAKCRPYQSGVAAQQEVDRARSLRNRGTLTTGGEAMLLRTPTRPAVPTC
jgi:hypothetical protein